MTPRIFIAFYMDLIIYPQIHGKPISARWLKINLLETVGFSALIFSCMDFESKCHVLGTTI